MLKVVGNESAQHETDGRSLLDEIAREDAPRRLLAAPETEVAAYLEAHRDERDDDGHALAVRNGKGRTWKVTVGAGTIPVSAPRVNDRRTDQDGERRRFTSRILPPYMRRSPKVAEVLPVLYPRGLSTGDFRDPLAAYKLLDMAQARWRRLAGAHLLPSVRDGVAFADGVQPANKRGKPRARAA
jgi:putative transposase